MAAKRGGRKAQEMGRPAKPSEEVRHNRVVVLLTDAELAKLHRLAQRKALPRGTAAYEIVARALARQR
jgi:hypothetical protein